MFELISQYPKLVVAILAPVFLVLGYLYRSRKEKRSNFKAALYILLEIWHKMSIFYRKDFNVHFDTLINELMKVVPEGEFTEAQREATKEYYMPIIKQSAQSSALSDFDHYADSFESVVELISINDPFFAYEISSSGKVKSYLARLDSYLAVAMQPLDEEGGDSGLLSKTLKDHLTSYASTDALDELEKTLKKLSLKVSVFAYFQACKTINKRKKQLNEFSPKEAQELIEKVLLPAMNEFNNSSKRDAVTAAPS